MSEKLIKLSEVIERTGLCRSHVYTLERFPRPIKVGKRASAWISSEVDLWIAQTIQAQRASQEESK
jgi:prophage regulatory protein